MFGGADSSILSCYTSFESTRAADLDYVRDRFHSRTLCNNKECLKCSCSFAVPVCADIICIAHKVLEKFSNSNEF